MITNYNGRKIGLYYLNEGTLNENSEEIAKGCGKGNLENYKIIEQTALLYLIKDASNKKPRCRLKKIIEIKKDVLYERDLETKVTFYGIPIF